MNSMIICSRLLAAALCAAVLAGCNAVEDVPDEPSANLPDQTVVLGGHIKDIGNRRPLVLQLNGQDVCLVPVAANDPTGRRVVSECRFLGVPDQEFSAFSFGALPNSALPNFRSGDSYTITVKRQPYGKICTVQNPTGTLRVGGDEIEVTCVDDPAVARFTVTANILAPAASRPGLRVILTTENGTCPVEVNGRTQIIFSPTECPDTLAGYHRNATKVFNNGSNLPNFGWRVTATIPGTLVTDPPTNCFVTGGPVANTGGNVQDSGEVNSADRPLTAVTATVQSCGFTVRVAADYSRSPAETTDPVIAVGDAITVALRTQPQGIEVAAARITSFANTYIPFMVPDASGEPTATPYDAKSDPNAFYEVVVKTPPAGMACMPGSSINTGSSTNSATRTAGAATDAGAVLLRNPASAAVLHVWLTDRVIRCRSIAPNPSPLRGAYWHYTKTTTTTTVSGGAPAIVAATVQNRSVLAFFEDGKYLYGNHLSSASSNGVEQGFYSYNPASTATTGNCVLSPVALQAARSICFTGFTDTNAANGIHTVGSTGSPVPRQITEVVKAAGSPQTITGRVSNTTATGVTVAADGVTVVVNNGISQSVAAATYTTANFAALITAINNAANPGRVAGGDIAVAVGSEIRITGPTGGVVFGGAGRTALGLPTAVAAGEAFTTTALGTTLATVVNTIVDWILSEVGQDPLTTTTNPLDGAWVTWDWQRQPAAEDARRIFVYQHGRYTALHFGVNGLANLQEACYVGNFGLTSTWTRQGGRSGCIMRPSTYTERNDGTPPALVEGTGFSSSSSDIPNATAALKDYPGRWPQSQNPDFTDGRPYSLVDYEIRAANSVPADPVCPTVDKLTVWDTQNGVRKDTLDPPIPRIVLCRITTN